LPKKTNMNPHRRRTAEVATLSLISLAAVTARAASLTKVNQSEWQGGASLPSYVNMYVYVPDNRAAKPPILVAAHHCQGTGTTTFNETKSTFVSQADKNGYVIIFPEATGHNCWDVGSAKSLKHDGGGDTHAIAQMVRYAITKYGADASRVYAFGGSSGGMMTQALLGVYPDIFIAGVAVSGVPCGCWAEGYTGDVATNGQWSGPCAGGKVTKTAQAWGDLVRSMFPGRQGHRARVQLWHGDPDSTISFVNLGEAIKEWTNVLGLNATPTKTENTNTSTTHQLWNSSCGFKVLETFAIKGAGHAVQWDLATASSFLGLDKVGGQDPEMAACSGTGGTSGVGGASTGGATSGGTANGGSNVGGTKASGGSSEGGSATGGAPSATSSNAKGGTSAEPSATGQGGASTSGGLTSGGGNVIQSGTVILNTGGTPTSGGSTLPGNGGTLVANGGDGASSDGCSCAVPGKRFFGLHANIPGLVLGALLLRLRRQRRQAR
jgi:poly(hydroxyalkanoate) depolymerase family esterase